MYNIYRRKVKLKVKYCLSGRQPISVLKKGDEIKMQYEDREKIIDYVESLSDKTIILDVPHDVTELNWLLLKAYATQIDFMLCIHDLRLVKSCQEHEIKFYWAYPITSYYELRGILALNPCYLLLGAPLCFDLPKVKMITGLPIRLCPNLAYDNYIPRENGICGQWVRPEDTATYGRYVDAFEFATDELKREQVLFHIYKENEAWPGNLNLLLTNFGVNVDNRAIPEEIGEMRMSCGQRCMSNGTCHFCVTAMQFADAIRKKHELLKAEEQT